MVYDFKLKPCNGCIEELEKMLRNLKDGQNIIYAIWEFTDSEGKSEGQHIVRMYSYKE